jgi:uncharacterized surface protein with fasciclin (FAS1) repeats
MKLILVSKTVNVIGLITLLFVSIGMAKAEAHDFYNSSKTVETTSFIAQAAPAGTIVEIAAGNSTFSTLVKAVQAAGLVETLSGEGPFTVLAPTNKAFAALPKGTLKKLLKPENRDLLRKVLTYHVISGDLMARNFRSGKVATVEGSFVAVQVKKHKIRINKSNVVKADIDAKNGVIHVIDRVLLPPGL